MYNNVLFLTNFNISR